jgi:outer membrane protein assembly factor BamB
MKTKLLACLGAFCAICVVSVYTQGRTAPDWTTQGGDAQRTSWVVADPWISLDSLPQLKLLWNVKLQNETRGPNALTGPVGLANLMTFRGFKSLVFVGGSGDNIYAIDYDYGTVYWWDHFNWETGQPPFIGSSTCPGGMTSGLSKVTSLTPSTQLGFLGFARPPRPMKSEIGEPGKGAPQIERQGQRRGGGGGADVPARSGDAAARGAAANAPAGRGAAANAPAGRAAGARGANANARGGQPGGRGQAAGDQGPRPDAARGGGGGGRGRGPIWVYGVTGDGNLRAINPHSGTTGAFPVKFVPPNAKSSGLMIVEGFAYAVTSAGCGGAPDALWAMELSEETKPAIAWDTKGAPIAGFAFGTDGTLYAATGSGTSTYANSIVSLDPKTLQVKDWYAQQAAFTSAPVVFTENNVTYVASTTADGRIVLANSASLGGADHHTAAITSAANPNVRFAANGLSTWRDTAGVRWLLAATADSVAAYKLTTGAQPAIQQAWVSRPLVSPTAPVIVNGVIFALSGGREGGANASLYVLDPATGKDIWNSGNTMTSFATAPLATGNGQVFVVTHDNTVWAFGIPIPL